MQENSWELTGTQLGFAWALAGKWESYQLEWKQNVGSEPPAAQPAWKHHRTQAGVFCVGTGGARLRVTSKQEAAHTLQIRHATSELDQPCGFSALAVDKQLRLGQHEQNLVHLSYNISWPRIPGRVLEARKCSSCLYSSLITAALSLAGE